MNRRAFTLIEILVVITVGSVLMGVAVVMLAALLKSEGSSRRHLEYCTILNRLDDQFRDDVHAAAKATPGERGEALELVMPEPGAKLVRYRFEPGEIVREESEGEKILGRESFTLPEEVSAKFEQKQEGESSMLILRVEPKAIDGGKIHYPASSIEAVLSRDRRIERIEKPK
jgi:prepilin-type N-terminal cleavage/methylation domain-containing protein